MTQAPRRRDLLTTAARGAVLAVLGGGAGFLVRKANGQVVRQIDSLRCNCKKFYCPPDSTPPMWRSLSRLLSRESSRLSAASHYPVCGPAAMWGGSPDPRATPRSRNSGSPRHYIADPAKNSIFIFEAVTA